MKYVTNLAFALACAFFLIFARAVNQDESDVMSINAKQFRELVIRESLVRVQLWSPEAEELLMLTAAQESQLGTYIKQLNGPDLGVYQIEPLTHTDIWRYVNTQPHLRIKLPWPYQQDSSRLIVDLEYATVMARLKYLMVPAKIPPADQVSQLAAYWKKWYNTPMGAGRVSDAVINYHRYVEEKKND